MFAYKECLESLKYLAKTSIHTNLSYCQRLSVHSREFGFNDYHHFQSKMPRLPTDQFGKVSLRLMRRYCETARPSLDTSYCELHAKEGLNIAFYSYWIGWDKGGREVREPRPLDGKKSIDGIRSSLGGPVYVVENERQFIAWFLNWYGAALVPEDLAKNYFPEKFNRRRLVCDDADLDLDLVRSSNENYGNNIAT